MSNPNQKAIDVLRAKADLLEKHPELGWTMEDIRALSTFHNDKESLVKAIESIGGKWEKKQSADYFTMRQEIDGITVSIGVPRERVCERRVVTKIIPARPEMVLSAAPERTVEEVSWVCPDSILRPDVPALVAEADSEGEKQEAVANV